jgi:hypothetical protein
MAMAWFISSDECVAGGVVYDAVVTIISTVRSIGSVASFVGYCCTVFSACGMIADCLRVS